MHSLCHRTLCLLFTRELLKFSFVSIHSPKPNSQRFLDAIGREKKIYFLLFCFLCRCFLSLFVLIALRPILMGFCDSIISNVVGDKWNWPTQFPIPFLSISIFFFVLSLQIGKNRTRTQTE